MSKQWTAKGGGRLAGRWLGQSRYHRVPCQAPRHPPPACPALVQHPDPAFTRPHRHRRPQNPQPARFENELMQLCLALKMAASVTA